MRLQIKPRSNGLYVGILAFFVGALSVLSNHAHAQGAVTGNKAVYGTNGVTFSKVWIDASGYWTTGTPDLCGIINIILTQNYSQYPNGAVIDARGLVFPGQRSPIRCTVDPFQGVGATSPSTILLPAAVIPVSTTWTLPNNTKIIGEGVGTLLSAQAQFTGSYMIEMGSSSSCPAEGCSGVGIEHLKLEAGGNTGVNGIHNQYSQTPSYVNDVILSDFTGTGLRIEGPGGTAPGAIDSGPYSNMTYIPPMKAGPDCNSTSCPLCVDIEAQTRGIHGFTCRGNQYTANQQNGQGYPGIVVNASNNTLEDIHFEAFWDAIEVGNTSSATPVSNVVISNVTGSPSDTESTCTQQPSGNLCQVHNVVHICGPNFNSGSGHCPITGGTVSDVTILQADDFLDVQPPATNVIQDDVTGTTLVRLSSTSPPTTVGMYVLGEALGGNAGHTRFAVSPAPTGNFASSSTVVPTWGVGTVGVATQSCSTPGALYSNTQGTSSGNAVFVCTGSSGSFAWQPIPPIP
jgi:hypothetical protein